MSPPARATSYLAIPLSLLLVPLLCGCGGSPGSAQAAVSVPAEDFSLALSSSSVVLSQGSTAPPIQVSLIGKNGFSATVPITLSGLPQGVLSNLGTSFSLAAGASDSLILGATTTVAAGAFTVTASATSGSLSHSAMLALTIKTSVLASLPRTSYIRTDSTIALDNSPAEPRHRRIVYDSHNKHVFVANPAMNRVEVFSNISQTRSTSIDVAGASSVLCRRFDALGRHYHRASGRHRHSRFTSERSLPGTTPFADSQFRV